MRQVEKFVLWLLQSGQLSQAIACVAISYDNLHLNLSGRFHRNENAVAKGLLSVSDYNVEFDRIQHAMMSLIDRTDTVFTRQAEMEASSYYAQAKNVVVTIEQKTVINNVWIINGIDYSDPNTLITFLKKERFGLPAEKTELIKVSEAIIKFMEQKITNTRLREKTLLNINLNLKFFKEDQDDSDAEQDLLDNVEVLVPQVIELIKADNEKSIFDTLLKKFEKSATIEEFEANGVAVIERFSVEKSLEKKAKNEAIDAFKAAIKLFKGDMKTRSYTVGSIRYSNRFEELKEDWVTKYK